MPIFKDTIRSVCIEILMITRNLSPGQGLLALPGGFVDYGEDPEDAVLRELVEETGLVGTLNKLLCVRGDPERDPRKHIVSVVYLVDVDRDADLKAGDDAYLNGIYSRQIEYEKKIFSSPQNVIYNSVLFEFELYSIFLGKKLI